MSAPFSEDELAKFFEEVPEGVGDARKRFNPFEFFHLDEVALTRIMADLLNPDGSHGCADLFLAAFLTRIREARFNENTKTASVKINDPTGDGRLIDITISSERFVLGIENKPWAREGRDQVKDYLDELHKRMPAGDYKLLHLPGNGLPPPSLEKIADSGKRNRLETRKYWETLNSWLEDCKRECCLIDSEAEIFTFLEFFRRYVAAQREIQVFADYILEDLKNPKADSCKRLRIALAVANSMGEVRERVFRAFAADIERDLPIWLGTEAKIKVNLTPKIYTGAYACLPGRPYSVAVESQDGGKFIFGLRNSEKKSNAERSFPALGKLLDEKFGEGQKSEYWEWYREVGAPFRGRTADVVLEICSNWAAAVRSFSDRIKEVFEFVKSLPAK